MSLVVRLDHQDIGSEVPDLSFVIPAFNEEVYIETCLSSILSSAASMGIAYEILVVDNGSTDRTFDVASSFEGVQLISIERCSISAARNLGARLAAGRYLAFIDSDVVITRQWCDAAQELLIKNQAPDLTGCKYDIRDSPSYIEKYWFRNLSSRYINGGNLIVRRGAFLQICGFNEQLKTGEDVDFCMRAIDDGLRLEVDNRFRAIHLGYPAKISGFVRREIWHGEGDFKDFHAFFSSKVAMMAVVYCVLQIAIVVILVAGSLEIALLLVVALLLVNFGVTAARFNAYSWWIRIANMPLNYLYFTARSVSLVRALGFRKRGY